MPAVALTYACAFCARVPADAEELAAHLLGVHSVNALGFKEAPKPKGACMLSREGSNSHRVRCFCGKTFEYMRPIAPHFLAWAGVHTPFVDHLAAAGGIVAHLEDLRLQAALHKIERVGPARY